MDGEDGIFSARRKTEMAVVPPLFHLEVEFRIVTAS